MNLQFSRKSRVKFGDVILGIFIISALVALFSPYGSEFLIPLAAGLSVLALLYSLYQRPFLAKNDVFRNSLGHPMKRYTAYATYAIILVSITVFLISMVFGIDNFNNFLNELEKFTGTYLEITPKLLLFGCIILNLFGRITNT